MAVASPVARTMNFRRTNAAMYRWSIAHRRVRYRMEMLRGQRKARNQFFESTYEASASQFRRRASPARDAPSSDESGNRPRQLHSELRRESSQCPRRWVATRKYTIRCYIRTRARMHNILIPESICIMNKRLIHLIHYVNGTVWSGDQVVLSHRKRRQITFVYLDSTISRTRNAESDAICT